MSDCKKETMGEAVARFVDMSPTARAAFDRIRDPEQKVLVDDAGLTDELIRSSFICKTFDRPEGDEWLLSPYGIRMLDHAAECKDPDARYLALFAPTRAALREMVDAGETFVKYYVGNEALANAGFLLKISRSCAVAYELTELARTVVAAHRGQ